MVQTGLTTLDIIVLAVYFIVMAVIGIWSMFLVHKQEDFFLGSRSFGKMLQMFAAFGAGTNASEPIVTAKTSFTNGLSGIWSALLWLFVTPFYWITAVWYRRMRHLTLGDWYTERYQSKGIGLAYVLFGIVFYIVYLGTGMTAIGKMGGPLVGCDTLNLWGWTVSFEKFVIVMTAVTVLIYGVLGGLRAAYWTDFIQGIFIIILSIILIPVGLQALVDDHNATQEAAAVATMASTDGTVSQATGNTAGKDTEKLTMIDGFTLLHERVPEEYFKIATSPKGGEFPLHYILAITLLNLIGVACQPHFIATGGGSAKTEYNARFGLVAGNILKRFCTIGWALTALIALAYLAGNVQIAEDPDRVWGIATRELLGPLNCGLVGLMLACLLAALMSSASCYMLVVSGLVVRNAYATYIDPNASEKTYVMIGRLCSAVVIIGATIVSLRSMNVFGQLKFAWELPILFAAPLWIGIYWRRANKYSAWATIILTLLLFFLIPMNITKVLPNLPKEAAYAETNDFVVTREFRKAALTDVQRREAAIVVWTKTATEEAISISAGERKTFDVLTATEKSVIEDKIGKCPVRLKLGDTVIDDFKTGGKAIFWSGGVVPFNEDGYQLLFDDLSGKVTGKLVSGRKERVGNSIELFDPLKRTEEKLSPTRTRITQHFKSPEELERDGIILKGQGNFELDFMLYQHCGMTFAKMSNGTIETLRLPMRLALPFVFMIVLSLITPRCDKSLLDRYYVKMKTPVEPDPEKDRQEMAVSYENPQRFDDRRLFKFWGLEFNRPTLVDVAGFVISFVICFAIIALIVAVANFQP